jgi:hypothetical protein
MKAGGPPAGHISERLMGTKTAGFVREFWDHTNKTSARSTSHDTTVTGNR